MYRLATSLSASLLLLLALSCEGDPSKTASGNGTDTDTGNGSSDADTDGDGDTDGDSDGDSDGDGDSDSDPDTDTGDGTCEEPWDCPDGMTCVEGACVPGGNCGATEFGISRVKPNFIIILDRSCSMGAQKWPPAVDVITTLVTTYEEDIRFGLALFPDLLGEGDSDWHRTCGMDPSGAITVPVGEGNTGEIVDILTAALDSNDPLAPLQGGCQTNTYAALNQAGLDPVLVDPDRKTYFMLITDGEATCINHSTGGDIDAINALLSSYYNDRDIATFIVGFGDLVNPTVMNSHAVAGGTPRGETIDYYQADDQEGLVAATSEITGGIISCEYYLGDEAPKEEIFVFFNDELQVAQDTTHTDGWDYEELTNTVTFYGPSCDAIQIGDDQFDIDIVFGCAAPVIE